MGRISVGLGALAVGLSWVALVSVVAAAEQESLPVPAGLVIKNDVPQVPDSFAHAASLWWEPVVTSEPFDYVIEVSVPPRAGGDAPYQVLERRPGTAEPRLIISTTAWVGPYCFRVRVAVEKELGEPSIPVCVAKSSASAPFDVTNLRAELTPAYSQINLSWDFGSFPAPLTIQRSLIGSFSAPRDWRTISVDAPAREHETGIDYVDAPVSQAGWYCYRAKVTSEATDVIWSDEACVVRPVVDGPLAPDLGDSPAELVTHPRRFAWEFGVGGTVLALVGLANWWLFRGYR